MEDRIKELEKACLLWFTLFLMVVVAFVILAIARPEPCHAQDLKIPGFVAQSKTANVSFYFSRRCFYRSLSVEGKFSGPDQDAYALRVQCSPGYEQIKNPQIKSLPHGRFKARFNSQGLFWGYRIVIGVKSGKVRGVIR